MHTITTAMAWEYFARNRWTLLLFPFVANLMPIFVLAVLSGYNVSLGSIEFIGIYLGFVMYATAILGIGVFITQGSIARFYLKPLSTMAMVNFFFWGGALLVTAEIASSIAIWNVIFKANWPIAGPALFMLVLWGAFQPLLRVPVRSLTGIVIAGALVALVWYWFLTRHSDPLSFRKQFWHTISGFDLLFALVIMGVGYGLTLWRVQWDRCGRQLFTLTDRIQEEFERWICQYASLTRPFATPMRAHRWFDFQTRTFMLPLVCFLFLGTIWLIACGIATYYQDHRIGIEIVFAGTSITAFAQLIIAFVIGMVMIQGYQWNSGRKMRGQDQVAMKPSEYRIGHYMHSLPISNTHMARAILQSAAWSVGITMSMQCLSLIFLWTWISLTSFNTQTLIKPEIELWQLAIICVSFGVLLPFALLNNIAAFTLVANRHVWLPPIIIGTTILVAVWPLFAGIGLVAAVLGLLAYCTTQCLKRNEVTPLATAAIWSSGALAAIALALSFRPEDLGIALVIAALLGMLTILPFFSLPLALRYHRTT
jgi:hypothetical protein